ncbi:contractile injection system protein, VgrG/Pvc8 family [Xenophilus aerolatus]|nr:phage late control D family protein [Xenophilus aerolatus]
MSIFRGVRARTLQVQSEAIPQHLGAPALEIWRIDGRELLNGLFEYVVYLRTPDALNVNAAGAADYNLDGFIGREISVTIELDGAGEFVPGVVGASTDRIGAGVREINGLITDAQLWGEEGRHIQYRLVVRPWLHLATLTTDCKIFQNKTVVEILDEVLRDYSFPVAKRLIETYPARDYQTQLNETDFAFFERLCQEWGINYFFEHSDGKGLRSRRMQSFEPAQMIEGARHAHGALASKDTLESVLEYAPAMNTSLLPYGAEVGKFSDESGGYDLDLLLRESTRYPWAMRQHRAEATVNHMASRAKAEGGKPGSAHVLALWDAMGIAHELNGYRNDAAGLIKKYADERDVQISALQTFEGLKTVAAEHVRQQAEDHIRRGVNDGLPRRPARLPRQEHRRRPAVRTRHRRGDLRHRLLPRR